MFFHLYLSFVLECCKIAREHLDAEMEKKVNNNADGKKKKKKRMSSHLRLFQLMAEHMMRINKAGMKKKSLMNEGTCESKLMSTNDIMRMARSRFLQRKYENSDFLTVLIDGCSDTPFADDLELAMLIHASAHKVYTGKFERARKLLSMCRHSSSVTGNTIQKLVFYFAEALHGRITRELGSSTVVHSENPEGNPKHDMADEEEEKEEEATATTAAPTIIDIIQLEKYLPFCRIAEYTAMQYILDSVASARKVHLVDLGIRIGSHWPVLLQGLQAMADQSEYPLEMLKLTAIGSSKQNMEDIGKHLSSFAETMGIPFQFKIVISELQNIKEDMFEIEPDETLAICSELRLSSLLAWPDQLENLLQTISNLHPTAFVTTELDANTNASDFIDRFDEAINLASAVFDCIEDCLDGDTPCKAIIEHVYVREAIQNIITAEGKERVHRHQRIDTWREMLAKHGFTEVPPSEFARNQAKILVNNNPRWSGCTVDSDGKCMIVGWRGNPIKSVSAWTSQHVV